MNHSIKTSILASLLVTLWLPAQAQVIWSEEFDSGSVPNPDVWSYDLGDWGWGNEELQNYSDETENVRIEDGHLVITAIRETNEDDSDTFSSGRIRTEDKVTFRYATIEARIQLPNLAEGLWPAFWTLGNNFSEVGWPACGELDIFEAGSAAAIASDTVNRRVASTAHWEQSDRHVFYGLPKTLPEDIDNEFHIYRMEWTPTLITTYIDDEWIWAIDITEPSCRDCEEFHRPHFMILNMAVGGTYTQKFNEEDVTAEFPAELRVDWIRITDNGFTELGGSGLPEPEPVPAWSGSWYNATQSGHGFSMEFGTTSEGDPFAVIYWYTYDTDGNPIFLVGTGVPDATGVDIQFETATGMNYGEFDPDSVTRGDGGTARFEFSDEDNASFSYTPSEFSMSTWGHTAIDDLPLVKLFGIPDSNGGE